MLPVIAVALLVVVAVVAVLVFRRVSDAGEDDRSPAPNEGIEPIPESSFAERRGQPLPVVLVHGLFGFDKIARFHYFRGIAGHLSSLGCAAHAVRLPAAKSVPERARVLVEAIAALPGERFDLIAHSLGGLDARYALAKLGLAERVRSLVTIGTPHRGTPLADLAAPGGPLALARKAIKAIGVPLAAIDWLSTAALERFNADVLDAPGVRYACVVGRIAGAAALPLSAAHAYIKSIAGPNDGLVPVSSQYWGETLAEIDADHFQQIGWRIAVRHTFDALGLHAFVVARLGDLVQPAENPIQVASARSE
ncbi:MAG TPA: alpha/beta fold hydrolase [Kofleriaceae bacterium]